MANITTDILPIVMPTIDPAVRKAFEDAKSFRQSMQGSWHYPNEYHPWLTSLEALAKMLAGQIEIPHKAQKLTLQNGMVVAIPLMSRTRRYKPGDFFRKSFSSKVIQSSDGYHRHVCDVCHDAFIRREAYNKVLLEEK